MIVYIIYKSYILELTFLKELILIKQFNQNSVIFVIIGICHYFKGFNFNWMFAMGLMIY